MKQVTATGQTVEEAVESALAQLNTTKDKVEIDIIDEGKKGFLGIFGSREAIVKVTLQPDPIEEATNFLKNVSEKMGVNADIKIVRDGKLVTFHLSGEKIALLIGKRGQTLNSLQYLTQLVANRYSKQYLTIMLDAEDYRQRRNETLVQLADRMAQKVLKTKKEVALEPMPSYERKVIHTALMKYDNLKTYSSGTEPYRHIVISVK
ncbi:RNA-binding cell elongation regulator Jag/EloR [Peribacillus tepidiphilus]|uniref:RNA-binding cell elongation regulator Jag/EloR n=1 Tax=Peribacillus tepidiphilus TaxID=2652445 RepID=UPI0012914A1D|nr:RNA-binding cell elongation regulator Jag/EloR [Peribacillus tepidiphilus]